MIGENDSGKSAVIDAIKLVLQTQSGEFTRVTDEDFYIAASGEIATEFSIDCIFEGFESNEAKNFIEWLTFEKDKTSGAVFRRKQICFLPRELLWSREMLKHFSSQL